MEIIINKIQELLSASNGEYDQIKVQDALMKELNTLAKQNDTLLGRIIKFKIGDTDAMYVVTSVGKTNVRINWINYYGSVPYYKYGESATLSIKYALMYTKLNDLL